MRVFIFLFFLLVTSLLQAQKEEVTEDFLLELRQKIDKSEGADRLQWMDSLSNVMAYQLNFKDIDIIRKTIEYAYKIDSVNIAVDQASNLITYLNNYVGKAEEGRLLFEAFLPKEKLVTDFQALARIYIEGGDSYYYLEDYPTSINCYNQAEAYARKANDKKRLGYAYLYRGSSYISSGDFVKGSQDTQEAARIFREINDTTNIISAQNSLSILYSQNGFFEEAAQVREEAIHLMIDQKRYTQLVSFYYNAATDARKIGDQKNRIKFLELAWEASNLSDRHSYYEPILLSGFATAYAQQDSLLLANEYLKKAENILNKSDAGNYQENFLEAQKAIAFATGDYPKAIEKGIEYLTLKKKGNHFEDIQNAEKFLADVYERIGDTTKAYTHFKAFNKINDSITTVQKVNALSYYQTLYETEKRDLKIKAQETDIALLASKNRVKNQWIFFGGLGLLAIFSIILLVRAKDSAHKQRRLQESFSQDLLKTQEEERARVARELHDSVGQQLMLLTRKTKNSGDTSMETLATNTLEELRSISRGLHPASLRRLGFTATIEDLIDSMGDQLDMYLSGDIENVDDAINDHTALHIYRIIQELLVNIIKHADAQAASVTIEKEKDTITLSIRDNGKGFNYDEKLQTSKSLGMKSLLERSKIINAKLSVDSILGKGTNVFLSVPVLK